MSQQPWLRGDLLVQCVVAALPLLLLDALLLLVMETHVVGVKGVTITTPPLVELWRIRSLERGCRKEKLL